MSSLTPEFFSALVVAVIIIGLALAVVRLYADFTRPLPPELPPSSPFGANMDETQPIKTIQDDKTSAED